jgi:uncharacterized protein with NRDE domain
VCLIALAYEVEPGYRLVVAANRDEMHVRPSAPLHWWADRPDILAGRDLEARGTWMGISRRGRFAAITNFREPQPPPPDAPSRGSIVVDFLDSDLPVQPWVEELRADANRLAGFNLIVADGESLAFLSNRSATPQMLGSGTFGLSNGPWNAAWPKVKQAIDGLEASLRQPRSLEQNLFALLRHERRPDDRELPETGVGADQERLLSPVFIRGDIYGTRSSTVLIMESSGRVRVTERTWNPRGELVMETTEELTIATADG